MKKMKSIIILALLCILGQSNLANGQCFDLIHQYNQCKHLKMILNNNTWYFRNKYEPNKNIMNNELSNRFYRKLVSNEMTFDKAMNLFRKIYTETDNCTSEFCKCVSQGVIDLDGHYSKYFRNEHVFPYVKNIVEAFNKKFELKLLPYSNLSYSSEFYMLSSGQNLPSLVKFCIKYDYSHNRLKYYNNSFSCQRIGFKPELDCLWNVYVQNKTFKLNNLTKSDLAKILRCKMKYDENVTIEEQRFCTLATWVKIQPDLVWDKNLTAQIDALLNEKNPLIKFIQSEIYTDKYSNMIYIKPMKYEYESKYINDDGNLIQKCFDSKTLIIECEWKLNNERSLEWKRLNFTFNFDNDTSKTFSVDMSFETNRSFKLDLDLDSSNNEIIVKDKNEENWLMIRKLDDNYYLIIDFKYNIYVDLYFNKLEMMFPKPMLDEEAKGLLVDGFPELEIDLNKRKRRSIDNKEMKLNFINCQTMCNRLNQQSLVVDTNSFIVSKVAYNKCFNSCLRPKIEN